MSFQVVRVGSNPITRSVFCLCDGIGRHRGLKILCCNTAWGFDSLLRHHSYRNHLLCVARTVEQADESCCGFNSRHGGPLQITTKWKSMQRLMDLVSVKVWRNGYRYIHKIFRPETPRVEQRRWYAAIGKRVASRQRNSEFTLRYKSLRIYLNIYGRVLSSFDW